MTIIEIKSSPYGKCVACVHYPYDPNNWLSAECQCKQNKIKHRRRDYNSKACSWYMTDRERFK